MEGRALFEEVVARSGLAAVIGPGTVERALHAVGVATPEAACAGDYLRALPQIKARMAIYLTPEDVEQHVRDLQALLGGAAAE